MELVNTGIEGLVLLIPQVFKDNRGYFYESFNKNTLKKLGVDADFVQDNESMSQKDVLRGLHFQKPPFAQGKLVRVIAGAVLDVAVDIRKDSPTYGKHYATVLSSENKHLFYIPPGFAHGFLTLEDNTIFSYKCTNFYNKESEGCLLWNDAEIGINWNVESPILSEKDTYGILLKNLNSPF